MSDCINSGCGAKKEGFCMNDMPGVKCYGYEPPLKTNADRIRSMTDEELAKIISDSIDCNVCQERFSVLCDGTSKTCEQTWLDWLREAANG